MQTALQIAWIVGEAEQAGPQLHRHQVQQSLQQIKSQFKTQAEYVQARDQAGLTDADVLERAKLQLIQTKIQDNIQNSVGSVSRRATPGTTTTPTSRSSPSRRKRTIRIIQNKDAHQINTAYQALRADDSDANWKKVRRAVLDRPDLEGQGRPPHRRRAGLLPAATRRRHLQGARPARFRARSMTSTGTYVFEVISATPEQVQGFDDTAAASTGGAAARSATRSSRRSRPAAAGGADAPSAPTSATTGPT